MEFNEGPRVEKVGNKTVTIVDRIAEGGYGYIYLANNKSGDLFALKILQSPDAQHQKSVKREFDIQKSLDHPNIVKAYEFETKQLQSLILMEYCPTPLTQALESGLDTEQVATMFYQITQAVEFMHRNGFIHRDLKVENVLIAGSVYKLCDFGSATDKIYDNKDQSQIPSIQYDIERNTTPLYRSPEMIDLYRGDTIDYKSDIWALGCLLYKACTQKDAFPDGGLQILNASVKWPDTVDSRLVEIGKFCLQSRPYCRPSAKELLGYLYDRFPNIVDEKWKRITQIKDTPVITFEAFSGHELKQVQPIPVKPSQTPSISHPDLGDFDEEEEDLFAAAMKKPTNDPFSTPQVDPFAAAQPVSINPNDPFGSLVDPFATAGSIEAVEIDPNDPFGTKNV